MNLNKMICTGRLTKDPELRQVSEETKVCQLRLAVDGMGRAREVGSVNVAVFGAGGEAAAKVLAKGRLVAVDGRLEYGAWGTDGGEKRHDYSVVGNVEFLSAPKPAEESAPAKAAATAGKPSPHGRPPLGLAPVGRVRALAVRPLKPVATSRVFRIRYNHVHA
jgi:single-strand DNA-binding protein